MIKRALLALAVLATGCRQRAQSKLHLKVHTGSGVNGYDVNSTMISGDRDMLVIDPQFTLGEAHRLVAEILESKKNLTSRSISPILIPSICSDSRCWKQAFPSARIAALPATARTRPKNRMARQAKVLVPHLRQQYPRTRARRPGGAFDPRTHARRRAVHDHRRRDGRRSGEQLRLHSIA